MNLFWVYVFFSGDRRPAATDPIRASFLLAEIDSRQHALASRECMRRAAAPDLVPVWEVNSTRTRLGGTTSSLDLVPVPVCTVHP